jgi:polar amino acid transport system substrate-binding protein
VSYALALAVLATAVLLSLGACGEESTSEPTSSETASTSSAAAELLPDRIKEAGLIHYGSNFQEPPWGYYLEDGSFTGLDVELGDALAEVLGVETKWTAMQWDGLRPALQSRRFDAVIADMYDYTDRQEQVTFIDYVEDGDCAAVLKENAANVNSIDDLAGKKVGVAKGTSAAIKSDGLNEDLESRGLEPMEILQFQDDPASFLALRAGRIYAYIGEIATLNYTCQNTGNGEVFAPVLPGLISGVLCGVVVNKDDTDLAKAFQAALTELMANGRYAEILEKYGMTGGALEEATINGSTISSEDI